MPEGWSECIDGLREDGSLSDQASADLLDAVRPRWEPQVIPRTSLNVPFFTRLGDEWPFEYTVTAESTGPAFVFEFRRRDTVTTSTRCFAREAPEILDEFLTLLVRTGDP